MQPEPGGILGESREAYLLRWKMWLSHLVRNTSAHKLPEQKKSQKRFNKKARPNGDSLQIGSFVFYSEHL